MAALVDLWSVRTDAHRVGRGSNEGEDPPVSQQQSTTHPFDPTATRPIVQPGGSGSSCDLQGCCSHHGGITQTCSQGMVVCMDGALSPTCTCCS